MALQVQTLVFLFWLLILPRLWNFFRSFLLFFYFLCFFSIIKMENGPSPSHFPNEGSHSVCHLSTPIWDSWADGGLRASSFDCCCLGFFRHCLWEDGGSVFGRISLCHPFLFTVFCCLKYSEVFHILFTVGRSPISARLAKQGMFITLSFYCSN